MGRQLGDVADGLPMPRRFLAVLAISLGNALVIIDGAMPTVALPTLSRDLGVPSASAVLVITVYQLVLVTMLLPLAALGDRIGHSRLYTRGMMVFTAASILCFFAKSLPFLLVIRMVQALGAASALSVSTALIRTIYPSKQLGRGLGINSVVAASSAALAPTLGGFILAVAPWPWVALGLGRGPFPAFAAAALLLVAAGCSLARLNPALRMPTKEEVPDL